MTEREEKRFLGNLEAKHGKLRDTWEATTGKGRHIYLKTPKEITVRNSSKKLGPELDIRGWHGYVVAPPSLHYSGKKYQWVNHPDDIDLGDSPDWLIERAIEQKKEPIADSEQEKAQFRVELREGVRNDTLFNNACHLRDRGVAQDFVEHLIRLRNWNDCKPPLTDTEVDTLLDSAFSYPKRPSWKYGLSKGSEKVYEYLHEKSQHIGHCKVSREEIRKSTGICHRQISNCIKQLEKFGMVRVQEHKGSKSLYFPKTPAIPLQPLHSVNSFLGEREREERKEEKEKEI